MSADFYNMENLRPSSKEVNKGTISEFGHDLRLCDWLSEMRSLDEAVEGALHLEPFRHNDQAQTICGNVQGRDLDSRLEQLRESARLHLVMPFLHKNATSQEKANARLMLPSFFDSICVLISKTWHLAQARERHVQQLTGGYIERAQLCRQAEASGELDSMRKALQERGWELACAQKKIEQADYQRQSMEQLLLEVEGDKHRETWSRTETERRLASVQAKAAFAAKQRDAEYQSRLMEAREALRQAQGALAEAKVGLEQAEQRRLKGEERSAQLEGELTTCQQRLQTLLNQQRRSGTAAPPPGGGTTELLRARSLSNSSSRRSSTTISKPSSLQSSRRSVHLPGKDEQASNVGGSLLSSRRSIHLPPRDEQGVHRTQSCHVSPISRLRSLE
mmetsp:Transcript_136524/g.272298  ORF Transcript_136524/g.272298 Transcript_136524/m.272298 type:complete len:391 (+) Transcript_136524:95-1267(+)